MQDYKKYFLIPEEPAIVYKALTHAPTIQLWTGEPAVMTDEPQTDFSLFSDNIVGLNLEFVPDKKIVQQWYFDEQTEASIVTILLHPHKKGTSIELRHTNIPDDVYENMVEGWNEAYFGSLEEFYSGHDDSFDEAD